MSDLMGMFRVVCATKAAEMSLPLPVKGELIDISMNAFIQTTYLGCNELGFCQFKDEKTLSGTLWKKPPFSVRLTSDGQRPYIFDFPWPSTG